MTPSFYTIIWTQSVATSNMLTNASKMARSASKQLIIASNSLGNASIHSTTARKLCKTARISFLLEIPLEFEWIYQHGFSNIFRFATKSISKATI